MTTPGTPSPGGPKSPVPTTEDLRWDKLARGLQFEQLTSLRAVAEKWRTGLVTLTGLLAVALTVASPQAGRELDFHWRVSLGALQFLSLAMLAIGSWQAMSAAFGSSATIRDNGVALRRWTRSETALAERRLLRARRFTLAGFLILSVAAGVAVWGPRHGAAAVEVHTAMGTFCGRPHTNETGTQLSLSSEDGHVRTFDVQTVLSLKYKPDGC